MNAGKFDTLIGFERAVVTQDEYNEEVSAWSEIAQEWSWVVWGRGEERRQAAVEQGKQAATFRVQSNSLTRSVAIKDRITLDGDDFDILGIAPFERSHIDFDAVRAR